MRRHGLTLIELMVVITIIMIVTLSAWALVGVLTRSGDALTATENAVRAMVERGRADALARNARFELLLDYEQNSITLFERRPAMFYGFETPAGALNQPIDLDQYCSLDDIERPRVDGRALYVGSRSVPRGTGARARVPFHPSMNVATSDDGIAVSFDVRPDAEPGDAGDVIMRGAAWRVEIVAVDRGVVTLQASTRGASVLAPVDIAPYVWSHVELVCTPTQLRFYVNGVPASVAASGQFDPDDSSEIVIGGGRFVPMMIDNLRIEQLNIGRKYTLEGCALVPPGGDPAKALDFALYSGAVLPPGQAPAPRPAPLPLDSSPMPDQTPDLLPVRQALIYFDERGQLDMNFHGGPQRIVIVTRSGENFPLRRFIDIGHSGVVTGVPSGDAPIPQQPASGEGLLQSLAPTGPVTGPGEGK